MLTVAHSTLLRPVRNPSLPRHPLPHPVPGAVPRSRSLPYFAYLYPTATTLWRWPKGPFHALCTGCSYSHPFARASAPFCPLLIAPLSQPRVALLPFANSGTVSVSSPWSLPLVPSACSLSCVAAFIQTRRELAFGAGPKDLLFCASRTHCPVYLILACPYLL